MKTFITTILLCLSLSAYGDNPVKILGEWSEYWYPTGGEADVTYSDTMRIYLNDEGELSIECLNEDIYIIEMISFEDGILTFRKENLDAKERDDTPFYIYYTLIVVDEETMKGGIVNSVQQTNPMRWTKINR